VSSHAAHNDGLDSHIPGHRADDSKFKSVALYIDYDDALVCPIRDLLALGKLQGVWEDNAADPVRVLEDGTLKLAWQNKAPIRQLESKTANFVFRRVSAMWASLRVTLWTETLAPQCTTTATGEVCMLNEASTSTIKRDRKMLRLCGYACGISHETPTTFHMFRRQAIEALTEKFAGEYWRERARKRARHADDSDGTSSEAASYANDATDRSSGDEPDYGSDDEAFRRFDDDADPGAGDKTEPGSSVKTEPDSSVKAEPGAGDEAGSSA
jgi:hypothetical protein